jgi:hypothetical protein
MTMVFEFVSNLTAGFLLPLTLLARADELIE